MQRNGENSSHISLNALWEYHSSNIQTEEAGDYFSIDVVNDIVVVSSRTGGVFAISASEPKLAWADTYPVFDSGAEPTTRNGWPVSYDGTKYRVNPTIVMKNGIYSSLDPYLIYKGRYRDRNRKMPCKVGLRGLDNGNTIWEKDIWPLAQLTYNAHQHAGASGFLFVATREIEPYPDCVYTVILLDSITGAELWSWELSTWPTLAFEGATVFVGEYPTVNLMDKDGFNVYALSMQNGNAGSGSARKWVYKSGEEYSDGITDMLAESGRVYCCSGDRIFCLDASNGERIWEQSVASFRAVVPGIDTGPWLVTNLVQQCGVLLVATSHIGMFAFDSQRGELLWASRDDSLRESTYRDVDVLCQFNENIVVRTENEGVGDENLGWGIAIRDLFTGSTKYMRHFEGDYVDVAVGGQDPVKLYTVVSERNGGGWVLECSELVQ